MVSRYQSETFEHEGFRFRVSMEHDPHMIEPWKAHDPLGEVSDWTDRDKAPGERVLCADRGSKRYYDYAGAVSKHKCELVKFYQDHPEQRPADKSIGQLAAEAVDSEFNRFRAWLNDDWVWCTVIVTLLDRDGEETEHSRAVGGVEEDSDEACLMEIARELADELLPVARELRRAERLHNAAPDMLAALRTLVREHDCGRVPLARDWSLARAAIAKATEE